jgi:hypothetical protein
MSCGSPAGSEGLAPPLGQGGRDSQELENYLAQAGGGPLNLVSLAGSAHDLRFSATDHDTVAWTSGTLTGLDGATYAIDAGNTGNITQLTFIFLDINVSPTVLQTTTVGRDSVGNGRFLICVCEDVADTGKSAQFQVMGSPDSRGLFTANNIAANTITGNEIVANSIDATHVASLLFTGKNAVFTMGTVGGWTMAADKLYNNDFILNADDEQMLIGAATAPMTGAGIFIGLDGLDYEFRAGDPSGDYIHWNGSTLSVKGDLVLAGGTFAGEIQTDELVLKDAAGDYAGSIENNLTGLVINSEDATAAITITNSDIRFAHAIVPEVPDGIDWGTNMIYMTGVAESGSSGGSLGMFLRLTYNGNEYKIELHDP